MQDCKLNDKKISGVLEITSSHPWHVKVIRRSIQSLFSLYLIYLIYAGYKFHQYYLWLSGRSEVYVQKMPSIEAFLPIGALTSLKRLALTGRYDTIHPAGLTIFIAVIAAAFLFRKGVCGWICPVGFASNLLEALGKRLNLAFCPPAWSSITLSSIKYLILAFFLYVILLRMDLNAIDVFINSPYNRLVDARMLLFFLSPSHLTMAVLAGLIVLSILVRNPWCRFLCPYGALLGIIARFSPVHIARDQALCINCKKCAQVCPTCIKVYEEEAVRTPECQGCMECVGVCPAKGCLALVTVTGKRLSPFVIAAMTVATILAAWALAEATGHWYSTLQPDELKNLFLLTDGHVVHPSIH